MGRKRKIVNQNNNSVAKIIKQDDDEDPNENALNPLFMTEVLPKVLNYLDIGNLKNSRFVCTLWRFEGGKILLKKTAVTLRYLEPRHEKTSEEIAQLENFLMTTGTSAPFKLAIEKNENPIILKNMLQLFLERTRSLLFIDRWRGHGNITHLNKFLELFPNLQVLELGGSYWEIIDEEFSAEAKTSLLHKLESLKKIVLKCHEDHPAHFTNLLLSQQGLAFKEIELFNNPLFLEKYVESRCNWPIESLDLRTKSLELDQLPTVRAFLEKISSSLKNLVWVNYCRHELLTHDFLTPWTNTGIIPSTLHQLETLEMSYASVFSSKFLWLILTCALQLPNLKRLTMNKVPENLNEKIREWNEHPTALARTLKSESVQELKFIQYMEQGYIIPTESFIVFSPRLWPNLKSLYLQNPPNDLLSSFLLSEWIGLERLDMEFGKMNRNNANLWSKWFTGRAKTKDAKPDDSTFTLKDLKNLKHLGLTEFRSPKSTRIATDFLAENTLKFMTQLQSLHLTNPKMSREVREMLKETLGPTVNIVFQY